MLKKFELKRSLALLLTLSAPLVAAEQAMKVEELLAAKNNFKVDFSIAYSNVDQSSGTSGSVPIIDTGLLGIPITTYASAYGDQIIDRDILVYTLDFKYGVTDRLELVVYGNAHTSITRSQVTLTDSSGNSLQSLDSDSDSDFDNAGFGLTYKVKNESDTPSLLLGATANAISRVQYTATEKQNENFDSFNVYALSYYSVDPVVFVLKAAYQWSLEQTYLENAIDHADVVSITPEIYFAVNPYTNLSWGVSYKYIGEESINGEAYTNGESVIGFKLGMSYEIVRNNILTVEASKNDASSYSQSTINMMYSKRF